MIARSITHWDHLAEHLRAGAKEGVDHLPYRGFQAVTDAIDRFLCYSDPEPAFAGPG